MKLWLFLLALSVVGSFAEDDERGSEEELEAMKKLQRRRWPDRMIPIKFDSNFPQEKRHHVYGAMEALNTLTCVNMVNASESDDRHHILVSNFRPGCFAALGYSKMPGKKSQPLNLNRGCFYGRHKVSYHELLHALGFHHMQVRFERDDFVDVYKDKVNPSQWHNFNKEKGAEGRLAGMGVPYDYNSIMHYPVFAFGVNNAQTMKVKKDFEGDVGLSIIPSRTDLAALNRMYECWDHYLGDDIIDSIPYDTFHAKYFPNPKK
ncbi:hypothetical protein Pmani_039037 [Petrolisthes manimaculis]|uniref:Metalloendopeptidase n=1 Tax=Petrolisthes manimaculis TaxID=1843537 RepID=A0AAE1NEZ1_9EUCA|nr:hypothetical protein Pmani_039037 [Petrolisthes manimaculis]